MSNTISMKLELNDNGSIKDKIKDAEELHQTFNKVEQAAGRVSKAAQSAAKRSAPSPTEVTNYNRERGAAGVTGNASRDFAAQAQGLGGLVRLYATFAANIYATVAAFNALKQAANIEKMIEANQRFGESLGVNLRSVARDLQEATQYSLSFQDSIKFANIGAAAGLAAKDIKNLTVIAKGAATALGRDVGESIQRIIQGTAKQEQEILDELGIFIKSKKAFEEYAAARNMKVDDLSASQRTLAYAEAVAKAGEKWKQFADIDDPYGKLTASLQNTLNSVLSTINQVAAPIAKFFADNTGAILAFGSLITTKLLNTALPELKKGILGLITFDNSRAKAAADVLRVNLTEQFNAAAKAAADAAEKVKQLTAVTADLSKKGARTTLAKGFVIPDGAAKNRNSAGLDAVDLGKAFFSPKNLQDIKTVQDAQETVLKTIRLQLVEEGKRDAVLQDLINKKILEKGSTVDNLKLAEAGNIAAVKGLAAVEQQLATQQELNAAKAEEVRLSKAKNAAGTELNKRGGAVEVVPTRAVAASAAISTSMAAAGASAAGMEATLTRTGAIAQAMATRTLSLAGSLTAFKTAFVKTGDALQNTLISSAAKGPIGQFLDAGRTFADVFGKAKAAAADVGAAAQAAGTKVSVFGQLSAAAGAGASTALGAVRMALGGIMAALGPIMLAWTAWELLGPWIKETFFGITKELEDLREQAKQTAEDVQKSFGIAGKTIDRANKALASPESSMEEMGKALDAKANALSTLIEAMEKERDAADRLRGYANGGKEYKPDTVGATLGKENRAAVGAIQAQLKIIDELGLKGEKVDEFRKKMSSLEGTLNRPDYIFGKLVREDLIPALTNLGKEVVNIEDATKAIEAFRKEGALTESIVKSLGSLEGFISKSGLLEASEAKKAGFAKNLEGFKAYKDVETATAKLKEFRDTGKSTKDATDRLAKNFSDLGKSAILAGISTSSMTTVLGLSNAILDINTKITDLNAKAKQAAANGDTALSSALSAEAAKLAEQNTQLGNLLINASSGDAVKGVLQSLGNMNKATEEFTAAQRLRFKEQEQAIKAAEAALKAYKDQLDLSDKLGSFTTAFTGELDSANSSLNERIALLEKEYSIEQKKAALALDKATASAKTSKVKGAVEEAEKVYQETLASLNASKEAKTVSEQLAAIERSRAEALRLSAEQYELETTNANNVYDIRKLGASLEKEYAQQAYETLGLTKEEVAYENLKYEQQQKRLDLLQKEEELQRSIKKAKDDINTKAASASEATKAATPILNKNDSLVLEGKLKDIENERLAALAKVDDQKASTLKRLEIEKGIVEELLELEARRLKLAAAQAAESKKTSTFSKALVGLFAGTQFDKQSKAVANMLKVTQTSAQKLKQYDEIDIARKEKNAKAYTELRSQVDDRDADGIKALNALRAQHDEDDKKSAEERAERAWEVATESISAAKQVFAEKTAAYKVLDGIEKAMHMYKMATMAAEMAMQAQQLAITLKNAIAETLGLAAPAAASSAKDTPGPWPVKLAAGLAAFAFVASLAGGGGGGGAPVAGMSAKDKQSTQGTGMSWLNGEKVENGNGVKGDPEARSESIKKSIEIIADNTIDGLNYDNKMLKALESIDGAVNTTAKAVYGVKGITSGSAFGTQQVSTSSSGINGLFGSKTTSEIVDSGIKIAGMFTDLARGLGSYTQYETVQNTKKRSGFLGIGSSTSVSYDTNTTQLNSAVKDSIASIFANATSIFQEVGSKVGITLADITSRLSGFNINFEASLKGLTGKELEEALNSVISSALDGATAALFGADFSKFQEFGEGLLETVVRVVDTNDKMKVALTSIGITLGEFSLDTSEALADMVGGIEGFTEQVRSYRDTFLSEGEKLQQAQATVTATMTELRYSTVDTRDEFKALVSGLDLNTERGRTLYAELMKIAPAFALVTEKHQELIDEYTNLENEFLSTYRDSSTAKAELIRREEEGLSANAVAQLRRNKALQEEIEALEQYYSLADELDEYILDSAQLRAKERESIKESNLAIYDLLQAYKARAAAEEEMANALSEINSIFQSIKDAATEAAENLKTATDALVEGYKGAQQALAAAEKSFASAKQALVDLYFSAVDALENASKGVATALENITNRVVSARATLEGEREKITQGFLGAQTRLNTALENITAGFINAQAQLSTALENITAGYVAAKDRVANATKGITAGLASARSALQSSLKGITKGYIDAKKSVEAARAAIAAQQAANQKQLRDTLRGIGTSINDFISSLVTSDLSALNDSAKFNSLQGKFDELFTKALGGDTKAGEQLQNVASELLTAGKGQLSTSEQYATLFANVTDKLSVLSKDYLDKAGPEEINDGLSDLLGNLAEAEANFKLWEDAAKESGASLVEEQEDLLAEWKEASKEFTKWADAAALANAPLEVAEEDVAAEWKAATADLVLWQAAIDASGASLTTATKDYLAEWTTATKNMTDWQTAINVSGAPVVQAQKDILGEWKTAKDDFIAWDKAVADSGAARVKAEVDLMAGYKTAFDALTVALRAAALTGAPTEKPIEEDPLLVAYNTAIAAQVTAGNNLALVSQAVTNVLGGIPTSEGRLDSFAASIGNAVNTYNTSYAELVNARSSMADWTDAIGKAGITLDDIEKYTKDTSDNAAAALAKHDLAKAAKEKADADLATATVLTDGLITNTTSAIDSLKTALTTYNNNKLIFDTNDAIIRDTHIDSVTKAITDSADAIVSAITAAKETTTVVEDAVTVPPGQDGVPPYNPPIRDDVGTGLEGAGYIPPGSLPDLSGTGFPYAPADFTYYNDFEHWMNEWYASSGTILPPPEIFGRHGVPALASGGYHSGGLRLVGESGPELEVTGPSRIFNNSDTANIMSSLLGNSEQANLLKDVVAELKQVKSELATLSVISSKAEQHVKKSKDILENVTQGGDTLRTEGV